MKNKTRKLEVRNMKKATIPLLLLLLLMPAKRQG